MNNTERYAALTLAVRDYFKPLNEAREKLDDTSCIKAVYALRCMSESGNYRARRTLRLLELPPSIYKGIRTSSIEIVHEQEAFAYYKKMLQGFYAFDRLKHQELNIKLQFNPIAFDMANYKVAPAIKFIDMLLESDVYTEEWFNRNSNKNSKYIIDNKQI